MISIAHIIPEPLYRKNGKCAVEANPRQNVPRQNGGAKTSCFAIFGIKESIKLCYYIMLLGVEKNTSSVDGSHPRLPTAADVV